MKANERFCLVSASVGVCLWVQLFQDTSELVSPLNGFGFGVPEAAKGEMEGDRKTTKTNVETRRTACRLDY